MYNAGMRSGIWGDDRETSTPKTHKKPRMQQQPHTIAPEREHLSDIHHNDWVERHLPAWMQPYARLARLDRPIGSWLTLFPAWWGLLMAGPDWRHWYLFPLCFIGAFAMRGAGSTVNDIWDRNFDGQVARTRFRPLVSGQVSVLQAFVFLGLQLLLSLALLLVLPKTAIFLGFAILPVVLIYPGLKRVTHWPQVALGVCFNWGVLIAWAAVRQDNFIIPVLLWLGAVFWQVAYDTIYAYVDVVDDLAVGLKSTAIRFGDRGKSWIVGLYAATVLCWLAAGLWAGASAWYFYALTATALHLAWQAVIFDREKPARSLMLFRANFWPGLLMCVAAALA